MSRIGRMQVTILPRVEVNIDGTHVRMKGPKGEMEYTFPEKVAITLEDGSIIVKRFSDERTERALHGTTRAVINNMMVGVSSGFEKVLEINGVGYRADLDGKKLVLNVGYSHPVVIEQPVGIQFEV